MSSQRSNSQAQLHANDHHANNLLPNMKIGTKLADNEAKLAPKMMMKSSSLAQLRDPSNDLAGTNQANFFSNRNS